MTSPNPPEAKGLLYHIFDKVICWIWYINPARYAKKIGTRFNKDQTNQIAEARCKLYGIDVYILLKWTFIIIITAYQVDNIVLNIVKWILLVLNLHSFFYYIVWKEPDPQPLDGHRQRRRLIHLLQAIFFSHLVFASLYYVDYPAELIWGSTGKTFIKAFWLSVSNSAGGNYDAVQFHTDLAHCVMMVQYMSTFLFAGILISKAIPNDK